MHELQENKGVPLSVFISCAHEDEPLRRRLETHLSLMRRQGLISEWYDRQILAGSEWARDIDEHLEAAQIILLLVSPDFLASDYCYDVEMKRALERHNTGTAHVIPIMVRPTEGWERTEFNKLQALPRNGRPVKQWSDLDKAFSEIVKEIRIVAEKLKKADSFVGSLTTASTEATSLQEAPPSSPSWNIPYRRNPFFTGREEILTILRNMLISEQTAAISQPPAISGLGGIGKTQIAVEYAYRYQHEYQYVLWALADTVEDLFTSYTDLARLLHLPQWSGEDRSPVISNIKHWLETHSGWLLILDNANNLDIIDDFLPQKIVGHILITTRESAAGHLAQPIEVDKMGIEEAMVLLLRRAKYLLSGTTLTDISENERAAALAIVREMDGLPLAVDQAGAYIEETHCSLSRYLELFREYRVELLKRRGKHYTNHPESATATISLSLTKVQETNPGAAHLLKFCAFLAPNAIPVEIFEHTSSDIDIRIQAFTGNPLLFEEAVSTLLGFSLVRRDDKRDILKIHQLVQAILRDEMDEQEERQWAECAVRLIGTHLFRENKIARVLKAGISQQVFVCVGHIWRWDFVFPEAVPLLYLEGSMLITFLHFVQAEQVLEKALAICEQVPEKAYPLTAEVLRELATCYKRWGNYEKAERIYEQALKVSEQTTEEKSLNTAEIRSGLAGLYKNRGEYEKAERLYERVLAVYEMAENEEVLAEDEKFILGSILNNVGDFYIRLGKGEAAEPVLRKALEMIVKIVGKEDRLTAMIMNNLAQAYLAQGKYTDAQVLHEEALVLTKQVLGERHPDVAMSLSNLAWLYNKQERYAEAEQLHKSALEILEETLGNQHPDTARIMGNFAWFYASRERYKEAEPLYQHSLAIYETVLGKEHPGTIEALNQLGDLYEKLGKRGEAERLYEKGLAISEKTWGSEHTWTLHFLSCLLRLTARQDEGEEDEIALKENMLVILERVLGPDRLYIGSGFSQLGLHYYNMGRYEKAEVLLQKALAIVEKMQGTEHQDTASCLNSLGMLYMKQKRYEESEQCYKKALEILRKVHDGQKDRLMAIVLHGLGVLHKDRGNYANAEAFFGQALEIWRNLVEPEYQSMADTLNGLGTVYLLQSKYAEAQVFLQESLDICQKELGPEHPDTIHSLLSLGTLYRAQGRYEEAKLPLAKALQLQKQVLGVEHPNVAMSLNDLAGLYHMQGRYKEAESLCARALEITVKVLGPEHPDVAKNLNNLAALYLSEGRYEEAEPLYARALQIFEQVLGPKHPNVAMSLNNLAVLYQAQGRYEEAEPLYARSLVIVGQALGPDHPHMMEALESYIGLLQAIKCEDIEAKIKDLALKI